MNRIRRAMADLLGLYVLPIAAALLPWSLGFGLLKRAARRRGFYREATDAAWLIARGFVSGLDESEWKWRFRLLRMVDHTDSYLTLLRSDRWWQRRISVTGTWPAAHEAQVLLTYHWGAGHWIWRQLRCAGISASFLARRAQGRALGETRLSSWYGRFRAWALPRIGGAGVLFAGENRGGVVSALQAGGNILGMLDLAAAPQQRTQRVMLLDREALLPSGLVHLAIDNNCGITLLSAGVDVTSGRRELRIESLPSGLDAGTVMRRYAAHLDRCLRAQPAFWQIWCDAPGIFTGDGAAPPPQAL